MLWWMWVKGCERCQGNLVTERDQYGTYVVSCSRCGELMWEEAPLGSHFRGPDVGGADWYWRQGEGGTKGLGPF